MRLKSYQSGLKKGLDPTLFLGYDGNYNWIEPIPGATGACDKHSPAASPANWYQQLTGLGSLYHRFLWLLKDNQSAALACVVGAALLCWSFQLVKLMLAACHRSRMYRRSGQLGKCNHSLPNRERNKAIILTLLDTGLRASELCNAKIADIDLITKRISVIGKGNKTRTVPLCSRTISVIWRYLATRPNRFEKEPLFMGLPDQTLSRYGLGRLIGRLGQRSGVKNAHPHRFRHTFAINFLRNGGNIYVLQEILGHSTLDMVKRYLKLAEQDIESTHQSASPVANWNL